MAVDNNVTPLARLGRSGEVVGSVVGDAPNIIADDAGDDRLDDSEAGNGDASGPLLLIRGERVGCGWSGKAELRRIESVVDKPKAGNTEYDEAAGDEDIHMERL